MAARFRAHHRVRHLLGVTLFGVLQLALQLLPFGPSLYAWAELVYVALSVIAKAQLGIHFVHRALVEGAVYDNLFFHQFGNLSTHKAACADVGIP